MEALRHAIAQGPLRTVAVLAASNVDSVRGVLPNSTKFVVCDGKTVNAIGSKYVKCNTQQMYDLVDNGSVIAAVVAGGNCPPASELKRLQYFGSPFVSSRAMFMRTDSTADDLSAAVDAALTRVWMTGKDVIARQKNPPLDFLQVQSCQRTDLSAFPVPRRDKATGILRAVLDTGRLLLAGLPANWDNVGNYAVSPPTGFYPDFVTAFCEEFAKLAGDDGVAYGPVKCERVLSPTSGAVLGSVLNGTAHVVEPYYVVDASYSGTGESCVADSNCSGGDTCRATASSGSSKVCVRVPAVPRSRAFRLSCTTFGIVSFFVTRRDSGFHVAPWLAGVISASAIVLVVLVAGLVVLSLWLIKRERQGQPVFRPLPEGRQEGAVVGDQPDSMRRRAAKPPSSDDKSVEVDSL
eukprot:m51a1_g9141 putative membrane-bound protein (407) ;mRNA; f:76529-78038